jgi:multidrug/hemolysin transport system ATP-binding protein
LAKAIEVSGLVKNYGKLTAVDGISFEVEEGKLFAFLGPNGAGKSTTINIICTILAMTAGKVSVFGNHVGSNDEAIRRDIGVVFQDSVLDRLLTVRENLAIRGAFYGKSATEVASRLNQVVEVTGIKDYLNRPYGKLSGGQRRRADIARALMNTPKVLFLDEPTTGLDPQTRARIWETINGLKQKEGVTVFLTTHYMEEAAGADDVAIIDHGKIVARGTPDDLRLKYSSDKLRLMPKDMEKVQNSLKGSGRAFEEKADVLEVKLKDSLEALAILNGLSDDIKGFEVLRGDMDDVFIAITGRKIREGEAE